MARRPRATSASAYESSTGATSCPYRPRGLPPPRWRSHLGVVLLSAGLGSTRVGSELRFRAGRPSELTGRSEASPGQRVIPQMHRLGPATDEVGHVLAWLELAEEGDVGATQTEPSSHARLLRVRRRVKDVGVDAVIGNVDLRGVRVEHAHELVPGRLA